MTDGVETSSGGAKSREKLSALTMPKEVDGSDVMRWGPAMPTCPVHMLGLSDPVRYSSYRDGLGKSSYRNCGIYIFKLRT